jgi:hypothetical protein
MTEAERSLREVAKTRAAEAAALRRRVAELEAELEIAVRRLAAWEASSIEGVNSSRTAEAVAEASRRAARKGGVFETDNELDQFLASQRAEPLEPDMAEAEASRRAGWKPGD